MITHTYILRVGFTDEAGKRQTLQATVSSRHPWKKYQSYTYNYVSGPGQQIPTCDRDNSRTSAQQRLDRAVGMVAFSDAAWILPIKKEELGVPAGFKTVPLIAEPDPGPHPREKRMRQYRDHTTYWRTVDRVPIRMDELYRDEAEMRHVLRDNNLPGIVVPGPYGGGTVAVLMTMPKYADLYLPTIEDRLTQRK